MKKHILMITTIASFFCTQILPMDKAPSAEGIRTFKNFISQKLDLEIDNDSLVFYRGETRAPILRTATFLNWKTRMLDILASYHIDRKTGAEIFFNLTKAAIIQNLTALFSNYQPATIENIYNQYCADDLGRITAAIFKLTN